MKVIIGIDPGLTGAIAVLDSDRKSIVQLEDMPVIPDGSKKKVSGNGLKRILGHYSREQVDMVFLERVGARPGQGVVSMFSFGRSVGAVEATISLLGLPLTYISPPRNGNARQGFCEPKKTPDGERCWFSTPMRMFCEKKTMDGRMLCS